MTNPKTYYCAWHPEIREHDHILVTTEDRIWANLRWYYSTNTIEQLKSQGWQVKEVVIVDKETFEKMAESESIAEKHFIAGWSACESNAEFDGLSMSAHLEQYLETIKLQEATDDKD